MLTNASYRRFKPEDFEETTFVLDAFTFLVQNSNPIALNRMLKTDVKRNYLKMLWEKCISLKFTKFILTEENYMLLCQTQLIYQKAIKIVKKFVEDDDENIALLKNSLKENINTIQFAYSSLCSFQKYAIEAIRLGSKINLHLILFINNGTSKKKM